MSDGDKFHPQSELTPVIDQLREIIAQAHRLLKEPMPDTFLGRKTQEPFSKADKEAT